MRADAGTTAVTFAIPKRAGRIVLALVIIALCLLLGAERFDYWDAHQCINHLDGSVYEGTADYRSEFPKADTCKEYVHFTG